MTATITLIRPRKPQVLFICGNANQTTMMRKIAAEMPDCERWFSPYYCDDYSTLDILRMLGALELFALGHHARNECLAYLRAHDLPIDVGGKRGGYDLVVTCSDLVVPSNIAPAPLVGVQDGMIDDQPPWSRLAKLVPWLRLPRWTAGTASTGLSHQYARYCVASEGYKRDFVERGAAAGRIVVTGVPNFDRFAVLRRPGHWLEDTVLACTSDGRRTLRRDDRKAFIQWALAIAGDRPLAFKFHPNEDMWRASCEVRRWAPRAQTLMSGSGEEMAANCHTLVTEWSTLAFVGLALNKPTYSYRDLMHHRSLLPNQHGRAAANIAAVCRDVMAQQPVQERAA